MKKMHGRMALGVAAVLIAGLGGCKDSTAFWRTLDGGAAPTADYRPSQQNQTPAASTDGQTSQTASQTSEPQAPAEPK